jgi:hypothetical protein
MTPALPTDTPNIPADDQPRYFLDDDFDATADADWWLGQGHVDLPTALSV